MVSLLVLVSCNQPVIPPDVIIREQTKVLDPNTRTALQESRDDGTLVFSGGTTSNQVGDVIVSEPSFNAPNGLLRKVTSVETLNGKTLVHTEQAKLGDALKKGNLDVTRELTVADLAQIEPLAKGIKVQPRASRLGTISYNLDAVLYDKDGNTNTTNDQVSAKGSISIKPILDLHLSLDCGFACVYNNDLDFRFAVGVEETASLKILAKVEFQAGVSLPIFTQNFNPIVFFVGIVPVVITPRLHFKIKLDGSIGVDISYEATQQFKAKMGVKYDDGWSNISEINNSFNSSLGSASFNAAVTARAPLRFEFLLYGLVGPFIEVAAKLRLDAVIPRNPIWQLHGGVEANVGIHIHVLGYKKDYSANIFNLEAPIAQSGNTPPTVQFDTSESAAISDGLTYFPIISSDLEDGTTCCIVTLQSNLDGNLGTVTGSHPVFSVAFNALGEHTITATSKDSLGATKSVSIIVNITNAIPRVTIDMPTANLEFYVGKIYSFLGSSFDANEVDAQHNLTQVLPCNKLIWTSSNPKDFAATTGCNPKFSFESIGTRTITLTGTDARGATATNTVDVKVIEPPKNLAPVASISNPLDKTSYVYEDLISVIGSGIDPEGEAVKLEYTLTYHPPGVKDGITVPLQLVDGKWRPSDTFVLNCPNTMPVEITLHATDPQNLEGTALVSITITKNCK